MGQGTPVDARNPDRIARAAAGAKTVIIATPDSAIASVEKEAAPGTGPGHVVLHLSGALSSSVLSACRTAGADVGSMHPLQSFSSFTESLDLIAGSIFTCEGDDKAVRTAKAIAGLVSSRPVTISSAAKPLYHAAAVSASNFLVTLLTLSADLMEKTGMDRKTALDALMPLVDGTIRNVRSRGAPQALTGPVERGDMETVRVHLKAIRKECPDLEEMYAALTKMTREAARRKHET